MKNNITELVMILDRSGSMGGLETDTIGGYNSMLDRQKKEEGEVLVSTVLFDDRTEVVHDRVPLSEVKPLTEKEYYVRGCTALLDALGGSIRHIKNIHKYAREEDRPDNTIFVITTDGMENASRRYSYKEVKRLIEQQKENGWEFLFLGANIDAIDVASRVGISRDRVANYVSDGKGTALNYKAVGSFVREVRLGAPVAGAQWKEEIDEDYAARK